MTEKKLAVLWLVFNLATLIAPPAEKFPFSISDTEDNQCLPLCGSCSRDLERSPKSPMIKSDALINSSIKIQKVFRGFSKRKELFCDISVDKEFCYLYELDPEEFKLERDFDEERCINTFFLDNCVALLYEVIKETKINFPNGLPPLHYSTRLLLRLARDEGISFDFKHFKDICSKPTNQALKNNITDFTQVFSAIKPKILEVTRLLVQDKSSGFEMLKECMIEILKMDIALKSGATFHINRKMLYQVYCIFMLVGETDQAKKAAMVNEINTEFSNFTRLEFEVDLKPIPDPYEVVLGKIQKNNPSKEPLKSSKFGLRWLLWYAKQSLSRGNTTLKDYKIASVTMVRRIDDSGTIRLYEKPKAFILKDILGDIEGTQLIFI